MREVNWRLRAINEREIQDASFEAKIHGMEFSAPTGTTEAADKDLSPQQQEAMRKHLEKRQTEMKLERMRGANG